MAREAHTLTAQIFTCRYGRHPFTLNKLNGFFLWRRHKLSQSDISPRPFVVLNKFVLCAQTTLCARCNGHGTEQCSADERAESKFAREFPVSTVTNRPTEKWNFCWTNELINAANKLMWYESIHSRRALPLRICIKERIKCPRSLNVYYIYIFFVYHWDAVAQLLFNGVAVTSHRRAKMHAATGHTGALHIIRVHTAFTRTSDGAEKKNKYCVFSVSWMKECAEPFHSDLFLRLCCIRDGHALTIDIYLLRCHTFQRLCIKQHWIGGDGSCEKYEENKTHIKKRLDKNNGSSWATEEAKLEMK